MKLKIIPTESFKKDVKRLKKKNPKITESLKELNHGLIAGDFGVSIGKGVYKKRVRNLDLRKGKSGGFRVIGFKDIEMGKFYLLTIYSKSSKVTVSEKEIIDLLKDIGIFY
jgi:hypothetical protein